MTKIRLHAGYLAIITLLFSLVPLQLTAEDNIEEIIVSDFRSNSNRNIPSSVSILDADFIENISVQHFEEISHAIPNLNWAGGVSRPRYFQIRGIGERSQYEGAPNPSVGFVVDDLDFSALGGVATLFDVKQVEVLRGPQGTRYGANALAGLVYVQYQDASDEFDAQVTATLGSDDTQTLGTAFGGPLSEYLNYRLVVHKNKSNGFRENLFLKRDNSNGREESTLRLKLDYALNKTWNIDLSSMFVNLDNGYDAFAVDNGFATYSDRPGQDKQRSSGHVLTIAGDLTKDIRFKSISGFADSEVIFSFDADWGNDEFWDPVIYDFFSRTDRERKNQSQEFRFSSNVSDHVDWVSGLLWTRLEETNATQDDGNFEGFLFNSLVNRQYKADSIAVFGDINLPLTEKTLLNSGLRFESRDANYVDSNGDTFSPNEYSIGGQVALTYEYSNDTKLYTKVARGYKAGGFNLGLPAEASNQELLFDAEFLWNYELGLKGRYLNDRLNFNLALFIMQRRDQQVQSSTQLDPGNPNTFIFFTDNAGRGTNTGLEVDMNYQVTDRFVFYANLGILNTKIDNLTSNINAREQAHAPNYTYALGGRYDFNNNWFTRLDVTGKDEFFFSDGHNQMSQPYSLVNAKIGYETGNWSITAWGRNLFDQEYATRGFFFGNEPALDFADKLYIRLGDPVHYGLTLDYRF